MGNGKLRKTILLAITLAVIANFVFSNIVFAKRFTISDEDMKKIKDGLGWVKMFLNITITDDKLKSILNTTIKTGEISSDITYGLLVLTALNEMDFIDMVVSQKYKTETTEYFNGILDAKLNLGKYWQGIGYDVPKLLSGVVTGPIAALTLNTFDISDKTIEVLVALKVLRDLKMYNGLWQYFDTRKGGESHKIAWEETEIMMGGVLQSTSFLGSNIKKTNISSLEFQFFELYKKWGPYVTINVGVNKEYKEQAQKELSDSLVYALKVHESELVQEENKLSIAEKLKSVWDSLVNEVKNIGALIQNAGQTLQETVKTGLAEINLKIQQFSFFGEAGITSLLEESPVEDLIEVGPQLIEIKPIQEEELLVKPEITLEDIQEALDDTSEEIDVISQKLLQEVDKQKTEEFIKELIEAKPQSEEVEPQLEEEKEEESVEELVEEPIEELNEVSPQSNEVRSNQETIWCEKTGGALSNKMIFNEIAWMGTETSANDEWFELKNISNQEIDLSGWQILDKEKQIKIIFNDGNRISINGFLLLERTSDDSVPNVAADLIYTGALGNTNEALYLFNENCQLQDEILANPDWPAGDNNSKRTMERKSDLTWQTSANPAGTPKSGNSSGYIPPYYSGGAPSPASVQPTPVQETPVSYPKILISEIQISPRGERFIELYNPNSEIINLSDWYIQRKTKTGTSWNSFISSTRFEGKTIQPQSYFLVASSTQADILLSLTLTENNSLVLKNPNGDIVDLVGWGKAQDYETATATNPEIGKSIGRKWSTTTENYIDTDNNYEDFEIQNPTPKAQNQSLPQTQNQLPTACFTYSPSTPTFNQEIIFDSSSSIDSDGTITSYFWDFGDSIIATTTEATTSHSYSTSSDFLISLTVIDDSNATSTATTTITIIEAETEEIPF